MIDCIPAEQTSFNQLKKNLLEKIYQKLNTEQKEAVFTANGPLLVIAGAGSGKTTVLVNRVEYLCYFGNLYEDEITANADDLKVLETLSNASESDIRTHLKKYVKNAPAPWEVLCITFTNKAANEIKDRLAITLGESSKYVWAGTFHSICAKILRRHIDLLGGYRSDFTIYDVPDCKRLMTEVLKQLKIDDKIYTPKSMLEAISKAKENCIEPDEYLAVSTDLRAELISEVYKTYQAKLVSANALDFDDIILNTLKLFKSHRDVLSKYSNQFKYILVDEYQDTNTTQDLLVRYLASVHKNICVVGDDDQSIYAFRGAVVENILSFDKHYPNAKIIKLERNYRSTQTILNAANAIIANNKGRRGKELWTDAEKGERIILKKQFTQSEEAGYIVTYIKDKISSGENKYKDFAVLYRQKAQANALEIIFSKSSIPYRVFGSQRFYDRKEIKDLTAYLHVIDNPDDTIRIKRIINVPKRSIGNTTVSLLEEISATKDVSIYNIISNIENYPELQKATSKLRVFQGLIDYFRKFAKTASVSALIREVIAKTAYKEYILETEDDKDKAELPEELISGALMYEQRATESGEEPTLKGFLEEIALLTDVDNMDSEKNAVTLMTVHSAKGLEFDTVFLPGFEEGVFPGTQTMAATTSEMEEERRLAYVAVTRAKKQLIICHANTRLLYGKTSSNPLSRFALEIPKELVIIEQPMKTVYNHNASESKRKYANSRDSFVKNTQTAAKSSHHDFNDKTDDIKVGDRVSHNIFGNGEIISVVDLKKDFIYEIKLDSGTTKKVMASFCKLKKIN